MGLEALECLQGQERSGRLLGHFAHVQTIHSAMLFQDLHGVIPEAYLSGSQGGQSGVRSAEAS